MSDLQIDIIRVLKKKYDSVFCCFMYFDWKRKKHPKEKSGKDFLHMIMKSIESNNFVINLIQSQPFVCFDKLIWIKIE